MSKLELEPLTEQVGKGASLAFANKTIRRRKSCPWPTQLFHGLVVFGAM